MSDGILALLVWLPVFIWATGAIITNRCYWWEKK